MACASVRANAVDIMDSAARARPCHPWQSQGPENSGTFSTASLRGSDAEEEARWPSPSQNHNTVKSAQARVQGIRGFFLNLAV